MVILLPKKIYIYRKNKNKESKQTKEWMNECSQLMLMLSTVQMGERIDRIFLSFFVTTDTLKKTSVNVSNDSSEKEMLQARGSALNAAVYFT